MLHFLSIFHAKFSTHFWAQKKSIHETSECGAKNPSVKENSTTKSSSSLWIRFVATVLIFSLLLTPFLHTCIEFLLNKLNAWIVFVFCFVLELIVVAVCRISGFVVFFFFITSWLAALFSRQISCSLHVSTKKMIWSSRSLRVCTLHYDFNAMHDNVLHFESTCELISVRCFECSLLFTAEQNYIFQSKWMINNQMRLFHSFDEGKMFNKNSHIPP